MKIILTYFVIAVLAVAAGIGAGYAYQSYEAGQTTEQFHPGNWKVSAAEDLNPKAEVLDSLEHDFGVLTDDVRAYKHTFIVKNTGSTVLDVWLVGTDIRPVGLDMLKEKKQSIPIGETFPIEVTVWKSEVTEPFDVTIEFQTNEKGGEPLKFNVRGKIADQ